MKKTLLTALLLSGLSLFAGEPTSLNSDNGDGLSFRKTQPNRNVLKLKQTRFSGSGKDWDEAEVTGSGLFINFGLFSPAASYLDDDNGDPTLFLGPIFLTAKPTFKMGFNFEIGNYFRFAKISDGKFGIGLRATWLSGNFTSVTAENNKYRVAQFSPVRVGPQFGIGLTEEMGVDVFYQFGWNISTIFGDIDDPFNNVSVGASTVYTGISHEIGAAFHYKVFTFGLGYWFGKLTAISNIYDGEDVDEAFWDEGKNSISGLKINLGFKF